jgi:hypothetical protein
MRARLHQRVSIIVCSSWVAGLALLVGPASAGPPAPPQGDGTLVSHTGQDETPSGGDGRSIPPDGGGDAGQPAPCTGDITDDNIVNVGDLLEVVIWWGECPAGACPADVNGDGVVDVLDIIAIIVNWGLCD